MLLEKYGLALKRMQEEDCEMVRTWRNDEKISRFMFHRGNISSKMQTEWFTSINNPYNFFFIILVNNSPVGLINTSSIDWEAGTAYSGLFIYDDRYLASEIPVYASLGMLDFFLGTLGLQFIYAKVRGNNKRAHLYNTSLGFRKTKKIELGLGYEYVLKPSEYFTKTAPLRNFGIKKFGNSGVAYLSSKEEVDLFVCNNIQKKQSDYKIQLI